MDGLGENPGTREKREKREKEVREGRQALGS
jgi:hypothetical protein